MRPLIEAGTGAHKFFIHLSVNEMTPSHKKGSQKSEAYTKAPQKTIILQLKIPETGSQNLVKGNWGI